MNPIVEYLVSNTLIATVLCFLAMISMRYLSTPSLGHTLWLLALLKMITPPIFSIPIVVESSLGLDFLHKNPGAMLPNIGLDWGAGLMVIWVLGSISWYIIVGWRLLRFNRLLLLSIVPENRLQIQMDTIARKMGIQNCPRGVVVRGLVPPMLWGFVGRVLIVIPEAVWIGLPEDEVEPLLAHELAHFKRRDHWCRWLELLVTGLLWWNPVVWWARNGMRKSEEDCCDAWVLWTFPVSGKKYAKAILRTLGILARDPMPMPAYACGISGQGNLAKVKSRFELILKSESTHRMSWRQMLLAGLLAVVLLPCSGIVIGEQLLSKNADIVSEQCGVGG